MLHCLRLKKLPEITSWKLREFFFSQFAGIRESSGELNNLMEKNRCGLSFEGKNHSKRQPIIGRGGRARREKHKLHNFLDLPPWCFSEVAPPATSQNSNENTRICSSWSLQQCLFRSREHTDGSDSFWNTAPVSFHLSTKCQLHELYLLLPQNLLRC